MNRAGFFPNETQIIVMPKGNLSREYSFYNRGKGALSAASRDRCATFETVVALNDLQNERKIREKGMPGIGYERGVASHSASVSAPRRNRVGRKQKQQHLRNTTPLTPKMPLFSFSN